jgi:hypothetical protein
MKTELNQIALLLVTNFLAVSFYAEDVGSLKCCLICSTQLKPSGIVPFNC